MHDIIATFKDASSFNYCIKNLKQITNIKDNMMIFPEKYVKKIEKQRSSINDQEISSSGLENICLGTFIGFLIGCFLGFYTIHFNTSLLRLDLIDYIATVAIIFFSGATGSVIGFLIQVLLRQNFLCHFNRKNKIMLFLHALDDDTKEIVITNLEQSNPNFIKIY